MSAETNPSSCATSACSAIMTTCLASLPWYEVIDSLFRFLRAMPPENRQATSWLLATAFRADEYMSVVGFALTVRPSASSYHPAPSPSSLVSIVVPSGSVSACVGSMRDAATSSRTSIARSGCPLAARMRRRAPYAMASGGTECILISFHLSHARSPASLLIRGWTSPRDTSLWHAERKDVYAASGGAGRGRPVPRPSSCSLRVDSTISSRTDSAPR
mmetsp:Transcript_27190/g.64577  ORF Transcript_27190/g.64577 Transcript_27190/m.64577 type:complete len:217 (+) Transcript_27190:448-1098(+)